MARKSKAGRINLFDIGKGALLTAIIAVLTAAYQIIDGGGDISDIKYQVLLKVGAVSLIGYLLKNLATNSEGNPLKKEPEKPGTSTKCFAPVLFLLAFLPALNSCNPPKQSYNAEKVQQYAAQAIEITNKIWAAVNSPAADIAVTITPSTWDDNTKENIRVYLAAAMPYIGVVDSCKDEKSLEDLFWCIVRELKQQPVVMQNENLQRITAMLSLLQELYCKK